jgi:NDP-sugar pyrophosphorylase family protein
MIQDVVGDGTEFGLSVSYSLDGPVLLGTGGAMKQASHLLEESFFVLYGDSFLPIDFSAVENSFLSSGKPALMTILHNGDRWDKSNVLFRNGKLEEYNKRYPRTEMEFIDYGLGILSKSVFEYYTDYPLDLADVYHSLSLEGNLLGYEVHERFYEIGSIPGLKETETYFLRK